MSRPPEQLNVLLSAYSCTPHAGSEPGVGFETLRAVAGWHNVWVVTRSKNVGVLRTYFQDHPPSRGSVHVVGLDLSPLALRIKKSLGPLGLYWYYDRWQRSANSKAAELQSSVAFDVMHHVTFSSDWTRVGIADRPAPFVWGPIGGGARAPITLIPALGWGGAVEEALRVMGRGLMRLRPSHRRTWLSADVVLVQNEEAATLAPKDAATAMLPHSTALLTAATNGHGSRTREILMVGRLVPWKGGELALRSFAKVEARDTTLHFLGGGRDQGRLERIAERLGVSSRVSFEGPLPREVVLRRIGTAAALLHPAVHDESPITVGEALSMGTPVVSLNTGGPPELMRRWPKSPGAAIEPSDVETTATQMAGALERFLAVDHPILEVAMRPTPSYAESILSAYSTAMSRASDSRLDSS